MKILADIENAIIERIKGTDLGYTLRKVATYGGELGQEVGEVVRGFPAVLTISKAGLPQKSFNASVVLKATISVLCCASNLRNEQAARHGAAGKVGTYQIMEDVVTLLYGQTLGLSISPLAFAGWQPMMNDRIENHLLSVYALEFTTDIRIEAGVNPETLDDFLTFHANWDIPPHGNVSTELPADDTADATDHVFLGPPPIVSPPPVLESFGARSQLGGTSHFCPAPNDIEEGDLLLWLITAGGPNLALPSIVIDDDGFADNQLFHVTGMFYGVALAAYIKIATDNEPANYTFSLASSFSTCSIIHRISGHGGVHKFGTNLAGNSLIYPTPSGIETESSNCLIIEACARRGGGNLPLSSPPELIATVWDALGTGLDQRTLSSSQHVQLQPGVIPSVNFATIESEFTRHGITTTIAIAPAPV